MAPSRAPDGVGNTGDTPSRLRFSIGLKAFLKNQRNLCNELAIGYKLAMGNARYFDQTLFVKLEHFAKVTNSTPEKVRARLLTYDDVKGTWSGELAGGEQHGQWWVSSECLPKHLRNSTRQAASH